MSGFTTVATTVAMKVQRFTTVAKTVAKKTIGLAHMHFAPSDDSYAFVRTDSAPSSGLYGLVHTGCKHSIDHAAAAAARKGCVTGRHLSCVAAINPAAALCNSPSPFLAPPPRTHAHRPHVAFVRWQQQHWGPAVRTCHSVTKQQSSVQVLE